MSPFTKIYQNQLGQKRKDEGAGNQGSLLIASDRVHPVKPRIASSSVQPQNPLQMG